MVFKKFQICLIHVPCCTIFYQIYFANSLLLQTVKCRIQWTVLYKKTEPHLVYWLVLTTHIRILENCSPGVSLWSYQWRPLKFLDEISKWMNFNHSSWSSCPKMMAYKNSCYLTIHQQWKGLLCSNDKLFSFQMHDTLLKSAESP